MTEEPCMNWMAEAFMRLMKGRNCEITKNRL